MKKEPFVDQVTHAATHPVSSLAYAAGLVRGFAASVLRVAAGEKGPVMPGHLPGPVAAPVEEDVSTEDTVILFDADPTADRLPDVPPESRAE